MNIIFFSLFFVKVEFWNDESTEFYFAFSRVMGSVKIDKFKFEDLVNQHSELVNKIGENCSFEVKNLRKFSSFTKDFSFWLKQSKMNSSIRIPNLKTTKDLNCKNLIYNSIKILKFSQNLFSHF